MTREDEREPPRCWRVCRQDDNGNVFVVAAGLSEAAARKLRDKYAASGHKQVYWTSRDHA